MKTIRYIYFFMFLSGFLNAQNDRSVMFGAVSSHDVYFKNVNGFRSMYGLGVKIFVTHHISLNNRLLLGVNPNDERVMLHYGLGGVLSQSILSSGNIFINGNILYNLVGIILLPVLVPEGVQLHLGNDDFQVSPYVYPASFEYNTFGGKELKAILEVGTSFQMQKGNIVFAPQIGWKMRYGDRRQAFTAGLQIYFSPN